ncbi:cytokine receptor-like isoform X2 [Haliotis asinina]|uniref:cytokine receptor-like isoform X2 n=1 Tax=Haliotis asinina TaxID=109174 RepID=UPI003531F3E5
MSSSAMLRQPATLVVFFLSLGLHLATSTAFIFDSSGIVRPKNPYSFIGDVLNLTCNVTDPKISGNVSGYMYFTKQFDKEERALPLHYVRILSTRSIRLEYPVESDKQQGSYVCHLNNTEDGTPMVLGSQYVTVDYRAMAVSDINCSVYNWENMTCKWDLGRNYVNKNFNVQLVWAIMEGQFDCPHPTKTSCSWRKFDGRDSFHAGMIYYMSVIVTTRDRANKTMSRAQSDVFTVDTKMIVKPAPVSNLTLMDKNSTCLSLKWQHPKPARNMMYRLRVWQGQKQQTYYQTPERRKVICGLHPAMDYVLQVSCIPIPEGHLEPHGTHSEWTSIVERTLEDVPSGVPGVEISSFRYHRCSSQTSDCEVTIYWQPVPEMECNGEITEYQVTQIDTESGQMQEFEVEGSNTSLDLWVKKVRQYLIKLKARTRVGYSEHYASMVIPAYQYKLPPPTDILVEAAGSILHISWGPPELTQNSPAGQILGYTLYYCTGSKFTYKCVDNIQWLPFTTDQMAFDWSVPDGNLDNKMVGISAEMEMSNEVFSSGIMWNTCVYQKRKKPSTPQKVHFSPDQPDNGLRVVWQRPDCSQDEAYITHYLLSYCTTNSQGGCAGPTVNQTVSNKDMTYMIKDLSAGVKYRVTLRAVSRTGEGPESEPITQVVVNSDLNPGEMVGVLFACLFVLLLIIIVIIFCIKKVHKIKKGFYMHVDIPSLATLPPLREGDPLHDVSRHYPGRPLPQVPSATSHTGQDDGYSSADTDPSFDPHRYEPISNTGNNNNNSTKRNVSVSSETALLTNMEHNNEEEGKCQPYQVTQLSKIHGPDTSSPTGRPSGKRSKKPYIKKSRLPDRSGISERRENSVARVDNSVERVDNSVDSYLQADMTEESTGSNCLPDSRCNQGLPFSEQNNLHIPLQDAHVGFALTPPPQAGPPPPPAPLPGSHVMYVPSPPPSNSSSYITDVTALMRPFDNSLEQTPDTALYSRIGSDGSSSPPLHQGYVPYDQAEAVGHTPFQTSTPQADASMAVRPLSEYMKHLPLSYYEEPQHDQNGPTTEL